jgi:LPXTG-motif cell wall-anchored protein
MMKKSAHMLQRAGRRMTTKIIFVLAAMTALLFAGLQTASAAPAYPPSQPHTSGITSDGGNTSSPIVTRALASTGSDVTTMINIAAALLIIGVLGLYLARRRANRPTV